MMGLLGFSLTLALALLARGVAFALGFAAAVSLLSLLLLLSLASLASLPDSLTMFALPLAAFARALTRLAFSLASNLAVRSSWSSIASTSSSASASAPAPSPIALSLSLPSSLSEFANEASAFGFAFA